MWEITKDMKSREKEHVTRHERETAKERQEKRRWKYLDEERKGRGKTTTFEDQTVLRDKEARPEKGTCCLEVERENEGAELRVSDGQGKGGRAL